MSVRSTLRVSRYGEGGSPSALPALVSILFIACLAAQDIAQKV